jgi:hypothetical protein
MGARKRRAADRAGRPAMRSPGRPPVGRRQHRQRFWLAIARGSSSEDAGVAAGVSPAVGSRWFREGGGMPTVSRAPLSGRYLSFAEREEIAILRAQDVGVRETARQLGRSPSTISRELRRNAATRGGRLEYRATTARWHADRRAERPRSPSWPPTSGSGAMCRNGWRARSPGPTARQCGARRSGGLVGGTGAARIAAGRTRGVRSRSRTGCGSTSPMMGPCGSPMRPSTRRCTSKVAAPCAVS